MPLSRVMSLEDYEVTETLTSLADAIETIKYPYPQYNKTGGNYMLDLKIQLFASEEIKDPLEVQYLDQIAELKAQMDTMVAGEEYEKVLAEHKKLTDDFINRRPVVKKEETGLQPAEHYAKQLKENKFRSNKAFIETSLDYRDAFIKETGKDPWSDGGDITEDTKMVATHLRTLVDENSESASEFNFRLEQSLVDDPTLMKTLRSKK